MSFTDVHPGDPIIASNVQQVIDALKGTAGKGVPLSPTAVNNATNYALTVENLDATNSRALNVLKSDGSVLVRADATGVTLGSPITAPAASLPGTVLTNGSVANAALGPDVARNNLLTNPGLEIWQRGNGPFVGTIVGADRWQMGLVGTDTCSVSKDTTNVDAGSGACAACTFTLGTGAGGSNFVQGNLVDFAPQLASRPVALSVRVRTNVANAVRVAINNYYASTSHWTYSGYHSGGGTYETLTVTTTFNAALSVAQIAAFFNASCTAYLDNACLVYGLQPANYVPLHPADDLARCLRYYEKLGGGGMGSIIVSFPASAGSQSARTTFRWTPKVVTPTVTKVGTWAVTNCGQPTIPGGGVDVDSTFFAITSNAAGDTFAYNNGAGQYVSVEANS
jgi:hypothetical protein